MLSAKASLLVLGLVLPAQERRTPAVDVAERAGPAVVNISAEVVEKRNPFGRRSRSDFFDSFFEGRRRERTTSSLGSGVIIDPSGVVLTNEHVISRAAKVTLTLQDRRKFAADVVAADPRFDIAVLKIRGASKLPTVQIGRSNDLMPGEPVVAIGNPFGLSNSVTTGVVSALHRSIHAGQRVYEDFVQTDAAINPGNSGGALLNIRGQLIGVNTAIHQGANGIGFAIPIDKAMAVVDEVLQYGEVRPVFLGIRVDRRGRDGALIREVTKGSPAARAGLEPGDVIVDFGGAAVDEGQKFYELERALVPGQKVRLRYRRDSASLEVELSARELRPEEASKMGKEALGLSVRPVRGGLLVSKVRRGGAANRVGIKKGDALLSLAGRRLRTAEDFDRLCAHLRDAEAVTAVVGRNRRQYYVTIEL